MFQFYVSEINKFAFCTFFDCTDVSEFDGLIVQVFDRLSDKEENNIEDLKFSDWLFGPRVTHKWPDLRKHTKWKFLGTLMPSKPAFIPDFKGVQAFPYMVEDESRIGPWYPIHGLIKRGKNCRYEQVKHLEQQILTTSLGVEARTGMEYCRINGLEVGNYYNLRELSVRNMYWQMINIPIYKNIPKAIQGKALIDPVQDK